VCRIVALPTQSQVIVAGATAPHGPSAPGARLIEMSPRRSSGLLAMDAKSGSPGMNVVTVRAGLWA
jgi:hypothetical protein